MTTQPTNGFCPDCGSEYGHWPQCPQCQPTNGAAQGLPWCEMHGPYYEGAACPHCFNGAAQADNRATDSPSSLTSAPTSQLEPAAAPPVLPEQQPWAEAVIECVSDKAERERLIRLYDYDELVKACLLLGTLVLSLKADRRAERDRTEAAEAALEQLTAAMAANDTAFAEHIAGMRAKIDIAESALRREREDAERYRWLRSIKWYVQVMSDLMDSKPKFCVIGTELDAAIDAARKPGSEGG